MCEELFRGKLEVTVVPDCFEKSDTRRRKNYLYGMLQIAMNRISTIDKNMFLPIREGVVEVLHELKQLHQDSEHTKGWAESFGN